MNQKTINRAIDVTRALKPRLQTGHSFHTSFIFNKNKLLVIGTNDYTKQHRWHVFGRYKPCKNGGTNYTPSIHSEISALLKLGEEDCSRLTLLNLRIDNNDQLNLAEPCQNCMNILKQVGFKKILYSDENGVVRFIE